MTVECTHNHSACLENTTLLDAIKNYSVRSWKQWRSSQALRRQARLDRKALTSLSKLDERSLNDIGISKHDISWAAGLPRNVNASQALNEIRSQNIATARWQAMHKEIKRR